MNNISDWTLPRVGIEQLCMARYWCDSFIRPFVCLSHASVVMQEAQLSQKNRAMRYVSRNIVIRKKRLQ